MKPILNRNFTYSQPSLEIGGCDAQRWSAYLTSEEKPGDTAD